MKDFHFCSSLLSYDLSKISLKLAISLKHIIIFANFLEILLDNNVTSSLTHISHSLRKQKSFGSYFSLYFPVFIKDTVNKLFSKMPLKNSTRLDFRWLTKLIEIVKLYNRSTCRCYSLCFSISMVKVTFKRTVKDSDYCIFLIFFVFTPVFFLELDIREGRHIQRVHVNIWVAEAQ